MEQWKKAVRFDQSHFLLHNMVCGACTFLIGEEMAAGWESDP